MPFTVEHLDIAGLAIVRPRVFPDDRGFFLESFKSSDFGRNGLPTTFVQDNLSVSRKGTLRGLHFQRPPKAQGKLLRAMRGTIWDVAVDLRPGSATYLKWTAVTLEADEHTMFYIPPGFAHGFLVLSDAATLFYKCTSEYDPALEAGLRWNDPEIGVDWPVEAPILSTRDADLPLLRDIESTLSGD